MTGWAYSSLTPSNNLSDVADEAEARTNLDVYSKAETDDIAGTPEATELVAGKAKIATQYDTYMATDDTRFVTPKKLLAGLKYHLNASGSAPVYAIRAIAQGNSDAVSPVFTRNLNISAASKINGLVLSFTFTTAMPDNNYTVLGFGSDQAIGVEGSSGSLTGFDQTTTGFKVRYAFSHRASSQSINSFRLVVL